MHQNFYLYTWLKRLAKRVKMWIVINWFAMKRGRKRNLFKLPYKFQNRRDVKFSIPFLGLDFKGKSWKLVLGYISVTFILFFLII